MFTLVTSWIVRVAVLVILAGVAPVAMACYNLPWTQRAAQLWWRSMLGASAPRLCRPSAVGGHPVPPLTALPFVRVMRGGR
jgi:hypothetical protein